MNAQGQKATSSTGKSDDCWTDPRVAQWADVQSLQEALWQAQFERSCAALEAIHADRVMAGVIDEYNELYRDGSQARYTARALADYAVKDLGDDEAASFLHSWADATEAMLHYGLESRRYYCACDRQYYAGCKLDDCKHECQRLKWELKQALRAARAS